MKITNKNPISGLISAAATIAPPSAKSSSQTPALVRPWVSGSAKKISLRLESIALFRNSES